MGKYQLNLLDMARSIIVQTNLKNDKQRVFTIDRKKNKTIYKKWSKEYPKISYFAPRQEREVHVLFVGSTNKDKHLLLNNKEVLKVKKWQKKVSIDYELRNPLAIKEETYVVEKLPRKVKIYDQHDGTIMFRHKKFGEVLFNEKYNTLSGTYNYISSPDNQGHRLVVLDANPNAEKRMAYISENFVICNEAFHSFANDRSVAELSPNMELVIQLNNGEKCYYFIDKHHKRCSKKYAGISGINDKLIATLDDGNMVMLNALGKEVTPPFVDYEKINDSYVLQVDKHNNQCVVYNPTATTKNISTTFGKTNVCPNYNLILGDVKLDKDKKRCVVLNADNPAQAYEVDPCIGLLMISYLNGKRLNSHLINKVINNKAVIESSMQAFNDCINQSVPENKRTPITNRFNVCAKFLTKLKERTNYRIKRYEHQTEMLDQEAREMDLEYFGYIENYEAQIAELEAQKKLKEEEYKYNRLRKEEEIKLRGEEIDDEKDELGKKGVNAKKYKTYIDDLKAKKPNAQEQLLAEEEPENI